MIDGLMSNTIVALETDVATKEAEIATKTTEITTLTSNLATAESSLTTAQSDLATAQAAYNTLLASNTATVEQLTLAEAQVVTLQGQVATLQADYNTALTSLNDAQTELATKQAALDACIADLAAENAALIQAQSDLSTANATIIDLQDQLANSGGGGTLDPYLNDLNDGTWTFFPGQTEGASAEAEANFLDSYAYDAQTKVHSFTTKSVSVAKEAYAINKLQLEGPQLRQELDRPRSARGYAMGGYIEGPGTGRSDSIPATIYQNGQPVEDARLSDGEFVMTEQAVRGAGNGDRNKGAAKMYAMMRQFERGMA